MIGLTVLLVMFCVVLAFVLVGIDPCSDISEVRRKMARLFRRRDKMTKDWLIETMRRYDEVLGRASDFLERRGIKDIVEVDGVKIKDNQVHIKYTCKWNWEYVHDSILVSLDKFIGE